MSPSPVLRSRLRALAFISICALLVTLVSVWASRQHAGAPSRYRFTNSSITPSVISDQGGITPAGTITVNSTSDVANGSDGLGTLREAITAANNDAASGAVLLSAPATYISGLGARDTELCREEKSYVAAYAISIPK